MEKKQINKKLKALKGKLVRLMKCLMQKEKGLTTYTMKGLTNTLKRYSKKLTNWRKK